MIYLLENPEEYKNKHMAVYNEDVSTDRFLFRQGSYVHSKDVAKPIIFDLKVNMKDIAGYDQIMNNSSSLLVNKKIVEILQKLSPDDVQFFDAEVHCKDGILHDYKLLNITDKVNCVNHDKSIYSKMANADAISGFKRLVLQKECMSSNKLARSAEFRGHILVTEEIKQAFEAAHVTGVRFVTPEDYYTDIYPGVEVQT